MEFSQENLTLYFQQKIYRFIEIIQRLKTKVSCCDLCGGACQSRALLCDFCLADLPRFNIGSLHGNLLLWPAIHTILSQRRFDQLIAVAPYQWTIDSWIRQLKYHGRFELTDLLSSLLWQQWQETQQCQKISNDGDFSCASILLSVPIHLNKWQQRGFNQAHLLANSFAKKAQVTYLPNALIRVKDNKSQAGQTGVKRRKNLRNSFELSCELHFDKRMKKANLPEHVLLLDDVMTTGSTCNEICRVLKRHGVKKVTVLTLCLSLPKNANHLLG